MPFFLVTLKTLVMLDIYSILVVIFKVTYLIEITKTFITSEWRDKEEPLNRAHGLKLVMQSRGTQKLTSYCECACIDMNYYL